VSQVHVVHGIVVQRVVVRVEVEVVEMVHHGMVQRMVLVEVVHHGVVQRMVLVEMVHHGVVQMVVVVHHQGTGCARSGRRRWSDSYNELLWWWLLLLLLLLLEMMRTVQ